METDLSAKSGYRVNRFYQSLTEIQLIAGVERSLAIVNGTMTLAIVMRTGFWGFLAVGVVLHIILRQTTRRDPQFRQVYQRALGHGVRYDPWPQAAKRARNARPDGFDNGGLC